MNKKHKKTKTRSNSIRPRFFLSISKWLKVVSAICILSATGGFGLYTWNLNNKISDSENSLRDANKKFDQIFTTFERFTADETRALVLRVSRDVALINHDLDGRDETISNYSQSMHEGQRAALWTLASVVSSDYANKVASQAEKMTWDEMQNEKAKIIPYVQEARDKAKNERDAIIVQKLLVTKERDKWMPDL